MRLIVQDAEGKRAIRLKPGTWTLGSGADCEIRIQADGVAEEHLRLQVEDGALFFEVLQPGAELAGEALEDGMEWEHGGLLAIGGAKMKADLRATTAPAPSARASQSGARGQAAQGRTQAVQRRTPNRPKKSFPTWLILVLAVPALFLAWTMFKGVAASSGEQGFSERTSQMRIQDALSSGDFLSAEKEMAKVKKYRGEMTDAWKSTFDALEKKIQADSEDTENIVVESEGSEWIERRLRKFMNKQLQKNERHKAREFMRRAKRFKELYPNHSEMGWVHRMEQQFGQFAKMEEPNTAEDLLYELLHLTGGNPRDYTLAAERIAEFESREGTDNPEVSEFKAGLYASEEEYFDERMDLAAGKFERGDDRVALQYALQAMESLSRADLAEKGVGMLRKVPGIKGTLKAMTGKESVEWLDRCCKQPAFAQMLSDLGVR